ncbi:MAG: alpha/beta fold hydrolase [Acidobacteriota bacterium]
MHTASSLDPRGVLRPPTAPSRLRLFCFPYAGAGASVFRAWAKDLPSEIEVVPVQLPGRESRVREAPFTQLAPLLATLAGNLAAQMEPPFAFFGHSMGALLCYELARRLRDEGKPAPVHLFISGRRALPIPDDEPPLHTLDDQKLGEKLRAFNGTPEEIFQYPELLSFWLAILRADFAVCAGYAYAAATPLDCSISAFGGLDDAYVSRDEMAAWRSLTQGAFRLRMFPGDHFFLHSSRQLLLRAIVEDLGAPTLGLKGESVSIVE